MSQSNETIAAIDQLQRKLQLLRETYGDFSFGGGNPPLAIAEGKLSLVLADTIEKLLPSVLSSVRSEVGAKGG